MGLATSAGAAQAGPLTASRAAAKATANFMGEGNSNAVENGRHFREAPRLSLGAWARAGAAALELLPLPDRFDFWFEIVAP